MVNQTYTPWICTAIAVTYAGYLYWRLQREKRKSKFSSSSLVINQQPDRFDARHVVNIDEIDRKARKKNRISYCRCWKSETFPLCDGAHKCHNRENGDKVNALVLTWNAEDAADASTVTNNQNQQSQSTSTNLQ